jgi:NhaP-type Na+/H+ or K+/H+ antiporter
VLVLMGPGLLLGPVLGVIEASDFGKAGSVIATIALVVILFEGGTSLRIDVMRRAFALTSKLTLICFVLTAAIVAVIAVAALDMAPLPAVLLGAILAGTSSAVVIPMVESLRMSERPATVLVLESALTDVLCIVAVFALLQAIGQGLIILSRTRFIRRTRLQGKTRGRNSDGVRRAPTFALTSRSIRFASALDNFKTIYICYSPLRLTH